MLSPYSSRATVEKSATPTTPTSTTSSSTTTQSSVSDNTSTHIPEVVTLQEFINCSSPVNVCVLYV